MNERKAVFFPAKEKNTALRSKERMTHELLDEKKRHKNKPKNLEKKNISHFRIKYRNAHRIE